MFRQRSKRGSALAEFGPALGIVLLGFFFPVINLCGVFSSYACCLVLNSVQCTEAIELSSQDAKQPDGLIRKQIPKFWMTNGLGRLASIKDAPQTQVDYGGSKSLALVTITTKCTVNPWLRLPLPAPVPGMNAPITFTIQSSAPVESATDKE